MKKQIIYYIVCKLENENIKTNDMLKSVNIICYYIKLNWENISATELNLKDKKTYCFYLNYNISMYKFRLIWSKGIKYFHTIKEQLISSDNNVVWSKIENWLHIIQKRIYKSSLMGHKGSVKFLQNKIILNPQIKFLVLQQIIIKHNNFDKKLYLCSKKKIKLMQNLTLGKKICFKAEISLLKPDNWKFRDLSLLTILDKAKQKLVLITLEPEWEAKFEPNSYGFRLGRYSHDAVEAIFIYLKKENITNYVFNANLNFSLSSIELNYLFLKLQTLLNVVSQIKIWLKEINSNKLDSIFINSKNLMTQQVNMFNNKFIYFFIINIALHGLEFYLKEWLNHWMWINQTRYIKVKKQSMSNLIGIIRYGENFIFIHKNLNIIYKIKYLLIKWLGKTSKLEINQKKTKILNVSKGFNFLGYSFIRVNKRDKFKIKIYPSKTNQKVLIQEIGNICRRNRSISSYKLILFLRLKILTWVNYFRYVGCKKVFTKLDYQIYQIIRAWVFRRDRRNSKKQIKEKYFISGKVYTFQERQYQNNWIFYIKTKNYKNQTLKNWLPKLAWLKLINFIKVKGNNSPYDKNNIYWNFRLKQHKIVYDFLYKRY